MDFIWIPIVYLTIGLVHGLINTAYVAGQTPVDYSAEQAKRLRQTTKEASMMIMLLWPVIDIYFIWTSTFEMCYNMFRP